MIMTRKDALKKLRRELRSGMRLNKCRRCGCMKDALEDCRRTLPSGKSGKTGRLTAAVKGWLAEMKQVEYSCLGCKRCFGAKASNALLEAFPGGQPSPETGAAATADAWPPEPGEYFAFPISPARSVAVSTLASAALAEVLAKLKPAGLAITGKTETENTGIDKLIKNTITNPAIRTLIVAGTEAGGHLSGRTLLALAENGVDDRMLVIGSPGKRPILKNVTGAEVGAFRRQVRVVDMIGCGNARMIADKIAELARKKAPACGCAACAAPARPAAVPAAPRIKAGVPKTLKMDKAGYFVVIPVARGGAKRHNSGSSRTIIVEHYGYDNKLLHAVEGKDAPSVYSYIIDNGWLSELSHAAYLGRELAQAEISLKYGFKYVQDKAPGEVKGGEK